MLQFLNRWKVAVIAWCLFMAVTLPRTVLHLFSDTWDPRLLKGFFYASVFATLVSIGFDVFLSFLRAIQRRVDEEGFPSLLKTKSFPKFFSAAAALAYLLFVLYSAASSPRIHIAFLIHLLIFVPIYGGIIFLAAYAFSWSLSVVIAAPREVASGWKGTGRLILALAVLASCGITGARFISSRRQKSKEIAARNSDLVRFYREQEQAKSADSSKETTSHKRPTTNIASIGRPWQPGALSLTSDKSTYKMGEDMILTVISADANKDSEEVETIPLSAVTWTSAAGQIQLDHPLFESSPEAVLQETGKSQGVFQSIIKIPHGINGVSIRQGEQVVLSYEGVKLTFFILL